MGPLSRTPSSAEWSYGEQIMAALRRSAAVPKQVIERFNAILEPQN
jgi:hypothetical protein